jgi:hypothetical protein
MGRSDFRQVSTQSESEEEIINQSEREDHSQTIKILLEEMEGGGGSARGAGWKRQRDSPKGPDP